ncbi:hypothetical protein HK105_203964 [Polyrhizophydium stewartii]|uniref:Uncharacterized protein n=1 Tax=Polyrhizophydium stewartii TaxID=2732419 RepID=A0ABR4NAQ7_9FUNG|nr:hypothetical protein HK105_006069 [Polyrhizophydium stewartii]
METAAAEAPTHGASDTPVIGVAAAPASDAVDKGAADPEASSQVMIQQLTLERNAAIEKTERLAAELEKERGQAQAAIKEKAETEKLLKKAVALANRSRDKQTVQALMDENAKLRTELELLGDQKMQNDALKENIHAIVTQADSTRKKLEAKISHLTAQLTAVCEKTGTPLSGLPAGGSEEPSNGNAAVVSEMADIEIMRAQVKACEKQQIDLRTGKTRLEETLAAVRFELDDVKSQLEAERKRTGGTTDALSSLANASQTAKAWWSRQQQGTAGASTASAAGQQTPGSNVSHASSMTISNSISEDLDEGKSGAQAVGRVSTTSGLQPPGHASQQNQAQAQAQASRGNWWSRTTASATASATTTATPNHPPQGQNAASSHASTSTTNLAAVSGLSSAGVSDEQHRKLEQQLKAAHDEIAHLKSALDAAKHAGAQISPTAHEAPNAAGAEAVERLRKCDAQIKELENKLASAQKALEESPAARKQLDDVNLRTAQDLAATRTDLASKLAEIDKLTQQTRVHVADTEKLNRHIAEIEAHLADAKNARLEAEKNAAVKAEQLTDLNMESNELRNRLAHLEEQLEEAKKAAAQAVSQHSGDSSDAASSGAEAVTKIEAEMQALREKHAAKLTSMSEEHAEELRKIREHTASQNDAAPTQAASHPNATTQAPEASDTVIADAVEKAVRGAHDAHEAEIARLKEQHSAEIASLVAKHAQELRDAALAAQSADSDTASKLATLQRKLDDLAASHKTEIEAQCASFEKQKAQIQEAHSQQIAALEEKITSHMSDKSVIEALEKKHANEMDAKAKELAALIVHHAKQISEIEQTHKSQVEALRMSFESEKTQLQTAHSKQQAVLESQIKTHMSDASAMDALKEKHALELAQAKKELEAAEQRHKTKVAELEAKHQSAIKEVRASLEKSLADSTQQLAALHKQTSARIAELEAEVGKRKDEASALQKSVEASRKEIEALLKQASKNKEVSDTLVKSLQEQITAIHASKDADEKKLRAELDDKARKERVDLETKLVKERIDIEERTKKEKARLAADVEKVRKDFDTYKADSSKKFEKELLTKSEELGKSMTRLKTLEQELQTVRSEHTKASEALNAKVADLTKQLGAKSADAAKAIEDEAALKAQVASLTEQASGLQSKFDVLSQELEVARASNERTSKTLLEREEANKKLKSRNDELAHAESTLKRSIAKLEKDRDEATAQLAQLKERLAAAEATLASQAAELDAARNSTGSKISELEAALAAVSTEKDEKAKKLAETENEMKIVERKSAQIVKDLQKQLLKERKQKEEEETHQASHGIKPSASSSALQQSYTPHGPASDGAQHNPKIDSLKGDLMNLAQENEILNKRLRTASDRINRMTEDLEQKSKIMQQYILQEHASKLQPDAKPRTAQTFNMNILSSTTAMQKVDPAILSSINVKMQKLLEELTCKMVKMEAELKRLGGTVA